MDQLDCDENAEIKCINRQIVDCSMLRFSKKAIEILLSVDGFLKYMRFWFFNNAILGRGGTSPEVYCFPWKKKTVFFLSESDHLQFLIQRKENDKLYFLHMSSFWMQKFKCKFSPKRKGLKQMAESLLNVSWQEAVSSRQWYLQQIIKEKLYNEGGV